MLRTTWTSLLSLFGFLPQSWVDPEEGSSPDSGHEMDPNG
jgi:hypothetical protein